MDSVREEVGHAEWTRREIDWYLAEDRFLFLSEDEAEVQKWVLAFQWLLAHKE